jgi:hypothetical protein
LRIIKKGENEENIMLQDPGLVGSIFFSIGLLLVQFGFMSSAILWTTCYMNKEYAITHKITKVEDITDIRNLLVYIFFGSISILTAAYLLIKYPLYGLIDCAFLLIFAVIIKTISVAEFSELRSTIRVPQVKFKNKNLNLISPVYLLMLAILFMLMGYFISFIYR